MTRLLDVRYNAERAGTPSRDDTGALGFAYDRDHLGGPEPRAISFSMPLREEPFADRVVRPFFSGLLPDEGARQRLAGALGISAGNADITQPHRPRHRPAADRLAFIRALIFHYLVGNADAHGKNYALLHRGMTPDLAPLYDIVCTAAYPRLTKKFAMSIGGRTIPDTIQLNHWLTLVPDTRGAQRLLIKDMAELAERIRGEADRLLGEFEEAGIRHAVLGRVRGVIEGRAEGVLGVLGRG